MTRVRFTCLLLGVAAGTSGCPVLLGIEGTYVLEGSDARVDAPEEHATLDARIDPPTDAGADVVVDTGSDAAIEDAVVPVDAPKDAPFDGIVYPSDPGEIRPCASTAIPCIVGSDQCCVVQGSVTCIPYYDACSGTRVSQLFCDEELDCNFGEVCCVEQLAGDTVRSTCVDAGACGSGKFVSCRTNTECGPEKCVAWPCPNGPIYSTCGGEGFNPTLCY